MTKRLKTAVEAARVLREARDFLAEPSHWVKKKYWLKDGSTATNNGAGGRRGVFAGEADQVCGLGALTKFAVPQARDYGHGWSESEVLREAAQTLCNAAGEPAFPRFNDAPNTTHGQVLSAFDKAIELQCKIVQTEAEKNGETQTKD